MAAGVSERVVTEFILGRIVGTGRFHPKIDEWSPNSPSGFRLTLLFAFSASEDPLDTRGAARGTCPHVVLPEAHHTPA